ncbi:hypothetical protein D0Y65_024525 [Glycine soja]|uniref:Uncharacterized protein n=1 Tax=Glycine soja TaxID=3848 RepID=A0A445J2M8_GLYSO|nr:hypothetical protein D0Y65_024525 [Glycine soja]
MCLGPYILGLQAMTTYMIFASDSLVLRRNLRCVSCQQWYSNPCPFGPVPETGALDQIGHLNFGVLK